MSDSSYWLAHRAPEPVGDCDRWAENDVPMRITGLSGRGDDLYRRLSAVAW